MTAAAGSWIVLPTAATNSSGSAQLYRIFRSPLYLLSHSDLGRIQPDKT
jgi:hypothetical protein